MGNCFGTSTNDDISLLREEPEEEPNFGPPPPYQERQQVYHPTPNVSRPAAQLSEDEQIKIAKRLGLINHIPSGVYDGSSKRGKECAICMNDYVAGEPLRYLPCLHTYHKECIDDWLMRSFTCPSCMEPVESALLTTFDATN